MKKQGKQIETKGKHIYSGKTFGVRSRGEQVNKTRFSCGFNWSCCEQALQKTARPKAKFRQWRLSCWKHFAKAAIEKLWPFCHPTGTRISAATECDVEQSHWQKGGAMLPGSFSRSSTSWESHSQSVHWGENPGIVTYRRWAKFTLCSRPQYADSTSDHTRCNKCILDIQVGTRTVCSSELRSQIIVVCCCCCRRRGCITQEWLSIFRNTDYNSSNSRRKETREVHKGCTRCTM